MRITRRTSGGRGEYEISEASAEGHTPNDLIGKTVILDLGSGWRIDTQIVLTAQGGKRRLRRLNTQDGIQIPRQTAAALMLPDPVRADEALGRGWPVAREDQYAIEHIEAGKVTLGKNVAVMEASKLILRNRTYLAEEISVEKRRAALQFVWKNSAKLPDSIAPLVAEHRKLVSSGNPIGKDAESLVKRIQEELTEKAGDLGLLYRSTGEDALPDLLTALKWAEDPPQPPIKPEEIDPDDVEIKLRTVKDWKRWAAVRGAASARFRQEVRKAYDSTCVVCGLHLPATEFNSSPGVDAAHILPWTDFDLDVVSNGLCLCKTHHWAFDEGLLVIAVEDGKYVIDIPQEVKDGIAGSVPAFSIAQLQQHCGAIADERLPRRAKDRPNRKFLEMLRESSG